jgi:tetratricopeptide (TPR) repeat protein
MHKRKYLILGLIVSGLVISNYPTQFASAQQSISSTLENKLLPMNRGYFLESFSKIEDENDKKERIRIYDDRGSEERQRKINHLNNLSKVAYAVILGDIYVSSLEVEQALRQMIPIRREFGDRRGEISDFLGIAITYCLRMRHREAIENLKIAIDLARSTGDLRIEYQVLNRNITTTVLGGDLDQNVYEYLISRDSSFDWIPARLEYLNERLNLPSPDPSLFEKIGNSYAARKEYIKAIEAYKKSIAGLHSNSLKKAEKNYFFYGYRSIAAIQLKMGLLYKLIGKETEANNTLNNSLDSYSKIGINRDYNNLLTNMPQIDGMDTSEGWGNLTTLAIAKKSDRLISKVIQAQITRDDKGHFALKNIGDAYNRIWDYKTAINYYEQALKRRLEMKDINTGYADSPELAIARAYANIGDKATSLKYYLLVYNNYYLQYLQRNKLTRYDLSQVDQANRLAIFKTIDKIPTSLSIGYGANLLVEIGNFYKKIGKTDKAINFYQQANNKLDNSLFTFGAPWGGDSPQASILSDEDDVGKLITDTSKERKTETTNQDSKK